MNLRNLLKNEITQEDLCNFYNATITYENLPKKINGFVWLYKNIYHIFINKNLSYKKKKETILHELAHIELNQLGQLNKDFFEFKINDYEDKAEEYIKNLKSEVCYE